MHFRTETTNLVPWDIFDQKTDDFQKKLVAAVNEEARYNVA